MSLANLPTLAEVNAQRRAVPKVAERTRLDDRAADRKDDAAAEKAWRKAVIARDGKVCRCCQCKVVQQLEMDPKRLEIHHLEGRGHKATRWDERNSLVLCAQCHSDVTRGRLFITQIAAHLFTLAGKTYIDASQPVTFTRAAR